MFTIKGENYLTSKEAATMIGVTPDYVRHLIGKGKIKAIKMGNSWLIKPHYIRKIHRLRKPKKDDTNGSN